MEARYDYNGQTAFFRLPDGVEAPEVSFSRDADARTWEVILKHSAMPRPVATDLAAGSVEEAFALFVRFGYCSERFYAECFRNAKVATCKRR